MTAFVTDVFVNISFLIQFFGGRRYPKVQMKSRDNCMKKEKKSFGDSNLSRIFAPANEK